MRAKRRFTRYRKRLRTEFRAGDQHFKGISTNVSERGLFIRTRHVFRAGVVVNVKIYLPEKKHCTLKGIVRYARRMLILRNRNGMGIELLEKDSVYMGFIRSLEALSSKKAA